MVTNVTPTFMKYCIEAWRKDYKLFYAVYKTEQELFGTKYNNENVVQILNRPKTPSFQRNGLKTMARVWLARYFRPVSNALFDGATDEEAIKLWINTDRKDLGSLQQEMVTEDNEIHRTRRINMREAFNKSGAFFLPK